MGSAAGPYSSLDEQIFACIEATKTYDKDAKLEDFQLRIVGNDLVLFNLKTSRTYLLHDEDDEPLGPESHPIAAREPARTRGPYSADFRFPVIGITAFPNLSHK
jgi:hypothetical protein